MRIVISSSMEAETTTEFSNGGKAIVELSVRRPEIRVGKLTIWVRSFEIEKL